MVKKIDTYSGYRYSTEIISHAVWLYFRFTLSFQNVEEILAYRRVIVNHETIRQWRPKFGQIYANTFRCRQPKRGDKWHLDEVVFTMNGKHGYLRMERRNAKSFPASSTGNIKAMSALTVENDLPARLRLEWQRAANCVHPAFQPSAPKVQDLLASEHSYRQIGRLLDLARILSWKLSNENV